MTSPETFLEFAVEAAEQAGRATLAHFRTDLAVEMKPDASPVTIADREAESLLRTLIRARFPDHAIVGEEYGEERSDSPYCWFLDPIDGTRSFIRGVPLYGVLVGLEIAGEMVVGVAHFPALAETVAAAKEAGCRWNGRPARVSGCRRLDEALVAFTDPRALAGHGQEAAWEQILAATGTQRGWGDGYGHCLVATGRAEVALDPIVSAWDCAALKPIVEEAGGTFTDWAGRPTIHGRSAISTNGHLFEPLMDLLADAGG